MSAVVVGVVLEVVAGACHALSARLGFYRPTAPKRASAALPPRQAWLLYALSGGAATGGLTSLHDALGWRGWAVGAVVLLGASISFALLLRLRARRRVRR